MEEKKRFWRSLLPVLVFVSVLWLIRLFQVYTGADFYFLGILPRTLQGLAGILFSPFVHGDYEHLLSNTLPLLVVGTGLFYFYREVSIRVIAMVWLFTNVWVWIAARQDFHIGASGLIYGFVCFQFFSGLFRRNKNLLAISFLVTFLYGSMVWGILPVSQTISWESHLFGSVAGVFAAVYFRKEGPQREVRKWEDEAEPTGPEYWMTEEQKKKFPPETAEENPTVQYFYKENNPGSQP